MTTTRKSNFVDDDCEIEAGSNEEADYLMEWDRSELVELIQCLDDKIWRLENESKVKDAK